MNTPMILPNIFSIIDLCLFLCFLYESLITDYGKDGGYQTVIVIVCFIVFVIVSVMEMVIPKLTLDIEKKLNPEKQGNVFGLSII